jgi:hypothetical protein
MPEGEGMTLEERLKYLRLVGTHYLETGKAEHRRLTLSQEVLEDAVSRLKGDLTRANVTSLRGVLQTFVQKIEVREKAATLL